MIIPKLHKFVPQEFGDQILLDSNSPLWLQDAGPETHNLFLRAEVALGNGAVKRELNRIHGRAKENFLYLSCEDPYQMFRICSISGLINEKCPVYDFYAVMFTSPRASFAVFVYDRTIVDAAPIAWKSVGRLIESQISFYERLGYEHQVILPRN